MILSQSVFNLHKTYPETASSRPIMCKVIPLGIFSIFTVPPVWLECDTVVQLHCVSWMGSFAVILYSVLRDGRYAACQILPISPSSNYKHCKPVWDMTPTLHDRRSNQLEKLKTSVRASEYPPVLLLSLNTIEVWMSQDVMKPDFLWGLFIFFS